MIFGRSTPVGNEINAATAEGNLMDVAKNLEIVDMVEREETGPADAVRAIQKRLTMKSKSVEALTISLLEMLVKNCGHRFHVQLAKKDFMNNFYKLVSPKGTAFYKDLLLEQLQSWVDAFGRGKPEFGPVYETYDLLVREGVEFPDTDLDALAPIHTPKASKPLATDADLQLAQQLQREEDEREQQATPDRPYQPPSGRITITEAEGTRLRGDCMRVRDSIEFVDESANRVLQSGNNALFADAEFKAIVSMQERLMILLEHVDNEDFIVELLAINDEINSITKKCASITGTGSKVTAPTSTTTSTQPKDDVESLINLQDDLADVSISRPVSNYSSVPAANPFDATTSSTQGWSTDFDAEADVFSNQGSANEQASSLATQMQPQSAASPDNVLPAFDEEHPKLAPPSAENGLSNGDFDSFLSERAAAPATQTSVDQQARERAVDDLFGL